MISNQQHIVTVITFHVHFSFVCENVKFKNFFNHTSKYCIKSNYFLINYLLYKKKKINIIVDIINTFSYFTALISAAVAAGILSISGCCCCFVSFFTDFFYSVNNINFVEKFALYDPLNVGKKWQAWPVAVLLTFSILLVIFVVVCCCADAKKLSSAQHHKIADSKQKITGVFFLPWFSSHENYPGLVGCSLNCTKNNVLNVAPLPRLWRRVSMLDTFFFTLCVVIFSFSSLFVISFYQFAFLHFVFLWIRVSAAPELFFLFNTIQKLIKFCTCRVEK